MDENQVQEKNEPLKPGYFNQFPLFSQIRNIKRVLGKQDASIQTTEAALLLLEELGNASDEGLNEYVHEICKRYAISRGESNFQLLRQNIYESFILQTYNLVEPFFKLLNVEYRDWNGIASGDWKVKDGDKNLDPFSQLIHNVPKKVNVALSAYPETDLFQYFRLLRNSVVHLQLDKDQYEKVEDFYDRAILPNRKYFVENYSVEAPNRPGNLNFSDFMLYTRSLKYFSNQINDLCFPNIASMVQKIKSDKPFQAKLKRYNDLKSKGVLLRRINAIRGYFIFYFDTAHKKLRDDLCQAYLSDEGTDFSIWQHTFIAE